MRASGKFKGVSGMLRGVEVFQEVSNDFGGLQERSGDVYGPIGFRVVSLRFRTINGAPEIKEVFQLASGETRMFEGVLRVLYRS